MSVAGLSGCPVRQAVAEEPDAPPVPIDSPCRHSRPPASPALAGAVVLAASLAGCATKPPADDPDAVAEYNETNDPLEPTNRVFYAINNGLDTVILRPLAVGYKYAVPYVVRSHMHNVLTNLSMPVALVNDMLARTPAPRRRFADAPAGQQHGGGRRACSTWPPAGAGRRTIRMPASHWRCGACRKDRSCSCPCSARPARATPPASAADIAMDPITWVGQGVAGVLARLCALWDERPRRRTTVLDDLDKIKAEALDPYATIRSLYRQHRQSQIDEARSDDRATVPAWFVQPSRP